MVPDGRSHSRGLPLRCRNSMLARLLEKLAGPVGGLPPRSRAPGPPHEVIEWKYSNG
jgi:hypothetical protein